MAGIYPIVGRKDTGTQLRLPIRQLQTSHPEQFTLLVLSLLAIQDRGSDFTNVNFLGQVDVQSALPLPGSGNALPSSYFNIAAIHGKPYHIWTGDLDPQRSDYDAKDPKDINPVPSRFGGYCNHGSVFFPTWHRPYVLLIEQSIGELAIVIGNGLAKQYPEEAIKWRTAARELRLPYWDWADASVKKEGLPEVFYSDELKIVGPRGQVDSVVNPFSYFPIEKIPDDFTNVAHDGVTAYFKNWKRTFRYAANSPNADKSNIPALQARLTAEAVNLRATVAALFTSDDSRPSSLAWDEFSNHTTQSLRKMDYYNSGSLEGVHDSIHDIIGGNGHMGFPDYAGFDPIFWLHHCNVDRLYALWEYCYPKYWMNDGYEHDGAKYRWTQDRGTYHQVYNEQLLPTSSLAPFRTGDGRYWNSDQARFLDAKAYPKYYTYPEFVGPNALPEDRKKARLQVQKYYGLNVQYWNAGNTHFVVVVELLEHAFNGPYTLKIYENTSGTDVVLGSIAVFARPDDSPCEGCSRRRAGGSVVRGIVPVEPHVVETVRRSGGAEDGTIHEQIKAKFKAELVNPQGVLLGKARPIAGGPPHDSRTLPNHLAPIKVVLMSSSVSPPAEGDQPVVWSEWVDHGDIFDGGHRAWRTEATD